MQDNASWLKLDTAAKLYPSISNTHNNATFRLAVILFEEVNKENLQEALVRIMPRFPSFSVTLKRGLFWYYFEQNDALPIVKEDNSYPCKRLKDFINNGFLFNVTYHKKSVIMECFHGLADGVGAIEFFKTMLYEYFKLCGNDMDSEGLVLNAEGKVSAEELENSYLQYYDAKGESNKLMQEKAYHILGTPLAENVIFATHALIDLKEFLAVAKNKNVTVTTYVSALLIKCIYENQKYYYNKKTPITISVPIDLRSMFPSHTLRNFMSYVNVSVKVEPLTTFDDILQNVSKQMTAGLQKEEISAQINKNVKFEKNPFIRMTFLFVKNIAVSTAYKNYGEGSYTTVLSNLRIARFPKAMTDRIDKVFYTLGVSALNPLNCVLVSYKDKISITFARGIKETEIIRDFFMHFSKEHNLKVELTGNEWTNELL